MFPILNTVKTFLDCISKQHTCGNEIIGPAACALVSVCDGHSCTATKISIHQSGRNLLLQGTKPTSHPKGMDV